ncbi:MAG: TRAP transporter substrate-binding protein [Pseudomonadota bacterium]
MTTPRLIASAATALALAATAAPAEETFSVVGSWSSLPLYNDYEAPFWTTQLPEASGGNIAVEMTTFNQMGVKGGDVFRLLNDGVFDVGMTVADYTVGDAPELEGLDVPLIATDAATARKAVDAARPMVADIMENAFGAKMLAIAPYPPQIIFCKPEVSGLADLEGLKIRGSGRMTTKLLEALGAEGVNVGFSEVPGALQRGVVDCAITGSGSGYSAGWHEVSTHVMPLPLGGWDPVVTAMNLDRWNSLDAETQALIQAEIAEKFENPAWETAAASLETDLDCLTGRADCPMGDPASMTLVPVTAEDEAKAREILVGTVLPDWAERAGGDWKDRWNASVGAATGVAIP